MILVDTNILVGLVDERDQLHKRASRDLRRARGLRLATTDAVLSEACFLLPRRGGRERLHFLLGALSVRRLALSDPWQDVFSWLDQYASHTPDFADAELVVATSREPGWKVWTYDGEFRTIWRRVDGSRVPLF